MQAIINKFNVSSSGEDLFLSWRDEFQLRQQIRGAADWEGVRLDSSEELDFLKRALYYGPRKEVFFAILYQNMTNLPILNCVREASSTFIVEFLRFIAGHILKQNPPARNLQFLINLYREELRPYYIELFNVMDARLCAHLMARTSNDTLRELLKTRQAQISKEQHFKHYGLIDVPLSKYDYPTIYGDKIQLMAAAAQTLKANQRQASPLGRDTIKILLDGADLLFRAGLLANCLALLARMLQHREIADQILPLSNEDPFHKQINVILRKTLPIYSWLVSPSDPHRYALELYRSLFPGFSPDLVSLLYLDIHSIVMASMQGHRQYARYELAQKAAKVLNGHPDDWLAAALLRWGKQSNVNDLSGLEPLLKHRMLASPHEAYVIMEVLRLWLQDGSIILDRPASANLFRGYLQLFYWLPGAPFMNEMLLQQLGPFVDEETRKTGEQIVAALHELSFQDYTPNLSELKFTDRAQDKLQQQLFLSKYMGVF